MKRLILPIAICTITILSCNKRSKSEQKAYVDSLFHVLSCSPTIVAGPYSLEDQLNACDLLIKEYPEKKEQFEVVRKEIEQQIHDRDNKSPLDDLY